MRAGQGGSRMGVWCWLGMSKVGGRSARWVYLGQDALAIVVQDDNALDRVERRLQAPGAPGAVETEMEEREEGGVVGL